MDQGARWAIEMFGELGIRIRERIPEMVRAEQEASADAQEASGHRSRGVFGQFWQGMLERFEEFASLPGVTLVRPGRAPYLIPVVNGVVLFPWRYGDGRQGPVTGVFFAKSDARAALFDLGPIPVQDELDLGTPAPGLSPDDVTLAALVREAAHGGEAESARNVVVVAIACSTVGVQDTYWGEVRLTTDGCLEFMEGESLLRLAGTTPSAVADSTRTFLTGEPPQKGLRLQGELGDEFEVADGDA